MKYKFRKLRDSDLSNSALNDINGSYNNIALNYIFASFASFIGALSYFFGWDDN